MTDTYVCSGWACTDCLFLLANGDTPAGMGEAETAEWLEGIESRNAGYEITLGMPREDHECASNFTVTFADGSVCEIRAEDAEDAGERAGLRFPAHQVATVTGHELETESDRDGECECEQLTFSWSACDVCGSNLGGTRDAVSFFKVPEPSTT